MHEVEFVSARYLEMAAAHPGLITRSRPVMIERRILDRRTTDRREVDRCDSVAQLLRAAFPEFGRA
jgi:hypothetical protein